MSTHTDANKMYHEDTSRISKSGLDLIAKCPAYYYEKYLSPTRQPEKQTDALIVGSAFHIITLEPDLFPHHFVIEPKFTGTGSVAKRDAFKEEHKGKDLIDMETYNIVRRMRDAVIAHPIANELLKSGIAEQRIDWTDPMTGAPCKAKPDWLNHMRLIVDLKSTEDASDDGFGKSAFKYRYHVQAPFYVDGARENNIAVDGFVFIAVEKKPPHLVNVFFADAETMALGRQTYQRDLQTYVDCVRANNWPGYEAQIKPLTLPAWAYKNSNL